VSRAANKFAKVVRRSHKILNSCGVAFEIKLLATTTLDVAFGVEADVEVAGREGGGKATEGRVEGRAGAAAAAKEKESVKVAATIDASNSTLRCGCLRATNFGANWVSVGFNRSPNAFWFLKRRLRQAVSDKHLLIEQLYDDGGDESSLGW